MITKIICSLTFIFLFVCTGSARSENIINNDSHYSKIGFFDVHICNLPNRTYFFKILFSSVNYADIESMDVFTPDEKILVKLNKNKYKTLKRKNKPGKRVFIADMDISEPVQTGWYKIKVRTKNGEQYEAMDFVVPGKINRVAGMEPSNSDKELKLPITLKWKSVTGAKYYKTFIRDAWTGKLVFQSNLIDDTKIKIPKGKLLTGGYYSWVVHARDISNHVLLGDFNMGSMSDKAYFSTAE